MADLLIPSIASTLNLLDNNYPPPFRTMHASGTPLPAYWRFGISRRGFLRWCFTFSAHDPACRDATLSFFCRCKGSEHHVSSLFGQWRFLLTGNSDKPIDGLWNGDRINLSIGGRAFGLLVLGTTDSLGRVQITDCHSFPLLFPIHQAPRNSCHTV